MVELIPKPKPRPATRRRSAVSQRTLSPADQKKILGEWYNMTKKAKEDGGKGTPKTTVGNNCPRLPKPPNTAKAIADKAGHRAAGTHPRARGTTLGTISTQNLPTGTAHPRARGSTKRTLGTFDFLSGTAHPAREARRHGTAPAIRQEITGFRSIGTRHGAPPNKSAQ